MLSAGSRVTFIAPGIRLVTRLGGLRQAIGSVFYILAPRGRPAARPGVSL